MKASKKNLPLISVFMPTYNHEKFLAESIDSVLAQDYQNIEIVVVDDCSIDGTAEIARDYAKRYPHHIKFHSNSINLGITATCNVTLQLCNGKYIAWTSGDDVWNKEKIIEQFQVMEADDNCLLCYHNTEVFDSETNKTIYYSNSGINGIPGIEANGLKMSFEIINTLNRLMAGISVMARREVLPQWGYDYRIPIASDWLMWIDITAANPNKSVKYIPKVLARYRRHANNITLSTANNYEEQLFTLAIVESRYPQLRPSVRKARAYYNFIQGVDWVRQGYIEKARICLLESGKHAWTHTPWLWWLIRSYAKQLLCLNESTHGTNVLKAIANKITIRKSD
jgi:glycosyltransferase involved in cell wall biosynthesis